jgi:hypothetical protein
LSAYRRKATEGPPGMTRAALYSFDAWLSCAVSDELAPEVDYQNSCIDLGQLMDTAGS